MVSLEHIGSQSSFDTEIVGLMGNLLPLCFALNESCRNYDLSRKVVEYKKSDLKVVNEFLEEVAANGDSWDVKRVIDRTLNLSGKAFNLI